MNALVPVTDQKAIEEIFLSDGLTKTIEAIKEDALNYVSDISTATGRKACKSKAMAVVKQRVIIDNAGKDLKEQYKIKCDQIDAVRKSARDTLDEVRDTVKKPVTDWEAAEEARIEAERQAVAFEMELEEAIEENKLFDREREIARKEAEMKAIEDALFAKKRAATEEKERIERETKIAKEAKEQAEKEAEEKIEAEKQAKIEVEVRAKDEAEKAEKARIEAIKTAEREKKEAIQKAKQEEIDRQNKERWQREKEERERKFNEERKAANVAHQRKINKEALVGFVKSGISVEEGKKIITLIAAGNIKHIVIKY